LRIADGGLRRRGRGEEAFLKLLWERWEQRTTPGDRARKVVQLQGMTALIDAAASRR
jgi:hypothetical protein